MKLSASRDVALAARSSRTPMMRMFPMLLPLASAATLRRGAVAPGQFLQKSKDSAASSIPAFSGLGDLVDDEGNTAYSLKLPADFFSEEASKMAEGPRPVLNVSGHAGDPQCNPSCLWKCASASCDQVCEPVCTPPECKTLCKKAEAKCETRCGPPRCAVICPSSNCPDGKCGTCRTVCSTPICTTQCSEDCHSHCGKPSCNWKCKSPEVCPKPACHLQCSGMKMCAVAGMGEPTNALRYKPPVFPADAGSVVGSAPASLDPNTLLIPQTPPPLWQVAPNKPCSTTPAPPVPTTTTQMNPVSPVRALKMQWASEDHRGPNRLAKDPAPPYTPYNPAAPPAR